MFFQQRPDYLLPPAPLAAIGAATGPQTTRINIPRTFPIEAIMIVVAFNQLTEITPAGAPTPNVDGLQNILRNVNLTVADGVRTRTVVDVPGSALLELAVQTRGTISSSSELCIGNRVAVSATATENNVFGNAVVGAAGAISVGNIGLSGGISGVAPAITSGSGTGPRRFAYMIDCAPPQVLDPLASVFMLPVTRYPSDPILTLQIAGAADIGPGFTASAPTVEVYVIRRFVNVAEWQYIDWDLTTQVSTIPAGQTNNFRIELLTPGSYFGTLYRGYLNTASGLVRADPTNPNNPEVRIESLGVNFRRFTFGMLRDLNDYSRGNFVFPSPPISIPTGVTTSALPPQRYYFPGSAYNDFLTDRGTDSTELGSVLDANIPVASGAQVNLFANVGAPTGFGSLGGRIEQIHWRAYGNLASLKGIKT